MRREGVCWESFVPHVRREGVCGESFVPHVRRARVCWESFVPKGQGVVVVGRIMSCSGVVLVPVGGLWRRPGAAHGHCGRALRAPGVLHAGGGGGFTALEAGWRRVVGVSEPWMASFPPIGGGVAAVRGGVVPTLQTTSVKNADNGLLVAKWSAFWAHQCLAVVRCSHVNPLLRVLTRTIARKPAMWSVDGAAQARMSGLTCGLEGPRADWRAHVRDQPDASRGPTLVSG